MNKSDVEHLRSFYIQHMEESLLPFWQRSVDSDRGGVYSCYNLTGSQLLSTNKYTWTQGRFVWMWSRLAEMSARGIIQGNAKDFLVQAGAAVQFLRNHAFTDDGSCAFLLTEDGKQLEGNTSIFADCFVAMGLCEYARVMGERDRETKIDAIRLYLNIRDRVEASNFRSEPYPVPEGMLAHSLPMIMLHLANCFAEAFEEHPFEDRVQFRQDVDKYGQQILDHFVQTDRCVLEYVPVSGNDDDSLLSRHLNPGHTMECMWFLLQGSELIGRKDWLEPAISAIKQAYKLGWDEQHGGLFRFVDKKGGPPTGIRRGHPYEEVIMGSWDTKLWWPHSEALYGALYGYIRCGDLELREVFMKTHAYVFRTFPNPDRAVGEWIQIRDRIGTPSDKPGALPVKDPFHIVRNCMLIIDLLESAM